MSVTDERSAEVRDVHPSKAPFVRYPVSTASSIFLTDDGKDMLASDVQFVNAFPGIDAGSYPFQSTDTMYSFSYIH